MKRSLTPDEISNLPGTSRDAAWGASVGIRNAELRCASCLDGHAGIQGGQSARTAVGIFYGMLGPELRSTRHQDGIVAAGSRLGWVGRLTDQQNVLFELTHSESFRGTSGRDSRGRLEHRYALSRTLDVRTRVDVDPARGTIEATTGVSLYRR